MIKAITEFFTGSRQDAVIESAAVSAPRAQAHHVAATGLDQSAAVSQARGEARERANEAGGDPASFQTGVASNGSIAPIEDPRFGATKFERLLRMPMADLFALLTQLDNEREASTAEARKEQKAWLDEVRAVCAQRQQGLPQLPPPTATDIARSTAIRHGLPQIAAKRLEQLRANKARGVVNVIIPKLEGEPHTLPPVSRLLREPKVIELITVVATRLQNYEITRLEAEDLLSPVDALDRLNRELAACKDLDRIRELRVEIATAHGAKSGVTYNADVMAARLSLVRAFEPARKYLIDLLTASEKLLKQYAAEAAETEKQFFASHGLLHQVTNVSNRHVITLEKFSRIRKGLDIRPQHDFVPNAKNTALDGLFGVTVEV